MAPTPRHKQELIAIAALLAGVFIGLTLLPWDVTGPAGRVVGGLLWRSLGSGAALMPVLGIVIGLASIGRIRELGLRRVSILVAGLVILLPFTIAVLAGIREPEDLPASYEQWTLVQRSIGLFPAMLVVLLTSLVGTAGTVILGLIALSSLTLYTLDWHPFGRLMAGTWRPKAQSRDHDVNAVLAVHAAGSGTNAAPAHDESSEPRPKSGILDRLTRRRPKPAEALEDLPPLDFLRGGTGTTSSDEQHELERLGDVLVETLGTFRVEGRIVGRTTGPVVTQYEVAPAPGVKVGRIAALADDLALAMRAKSIRIVAPIPGKAAVGVEVPNPTAQMVPLRDLLELREWDQSRGVLPIPLGKNLEGKPIIADLAMMPHLLVAGATGSGKSVCINSIITGLVYRYTPLELRLLMIDPKMVELSMYNNLPHLRHPVVTDNKQAAQTLKWIIHEMERRYELFHANGARNVQDFNRKATSGKELFEPGERRAGGRGASPGVAGSGAFNAGSGTGSPPDEEDLQLPLVYESGPLPYIVLIVDELADLMMTVQGEVEKPLAILAQKARATGIHLVLATQRPSVNVITGLIKANFPSRIAFRVASKVDSRTILDQNGAETLLGNGDMLFLPPGRSEPVRVQGGFISTEETELLMDWYRERRAERDEELERQGLLPPEQGEDDILEVVATLEVEEAVAEKGLGSTSGDRDPLFREAAETCVSHQLGSTSLLQRKLRIGYGRAARIIDQLYEAGVLGPPDGSRPRDVLLGMDELDDV
jgi:S-DNA-T family DNA segregation ATPase FtsK/SpoIIIE